MAVFPVGTQKLDVPGGNDRVGAVAIAITMATAELLRDFQAADALRAARPGEALLCISHIHGRQSAPLRVTLKIEVCTAEDVQAARDLTHKVPEGSA